MTGCKQAQPLPAQTQTDAAAKKNNYLLTQAQGWHGVALAGIGDKRPLRFAG
jgi:hypothetical protein